MSKPPLLARVNQIRYEAAGVVSVELCPPDPSTGFPPVDAGAHVDVHLPNATVRSYSLSNMPGETHRYVLGVLNDRSSRGGSRFVHEQLRVGTVLGLSNPRNHFRLDESAQLSVLVAGGIGITPLLCMMQRLTQLGSRFHLIYCARSRSEAGFLQQVATLAGEPGALTLHFDDERGGPPDLRSLMAPHVASTTHFYACGPAPMLAAYESALAALGQGNVHLERFAAAPVADAPAGGVADPGSGLTATYVVELRRSNRVVAVRPEQTVLDAVLEAGIDAPYSCCEGVCGACETPVIEGEVEHRDVLLSEEERQAGKTMMICVSRCRSGKLVLDL